MKLIDKILYGIGMDGLLHLGCSLLICLVLGAFLPLGFAVAITITIGAFKELYDMLHPDLHTCEWKDFICDLVGVSIAIGIILIYTLL